MGGHIVAVLADPHLSARRPYTAPAWDAAVELARGAGVDRVIVPGDLVLDACDDADDRRHSAEALARVGIPLHAVPGNHDIGDNVADPWMGEAVSEVRLRAWREMHGPDCFATPLGRWLLLGLNAQLLGTGLAAEAEQSAWAGDAVREARNRPVALFLHKPLPVGESQPTGALDRRSAKALLDLFGSRPPRLIVSGHFHQHRLIASAQTTHIWAPSVAYFGRDHGLGPATSKNPGVLMLHLHGDDVTAAIRSLPPDVAVDPQQLAARFGPAPRNWPAGEHDRR
jgi:3',5'-cyclic AMP phosphodiesterase CpdA